VLAYIVAYNFDADKSLLDIAPPIPVFVLDLVATEPGFISQERAGGF